MVVGIREVESFKPASEQASMLAIFSVLLLWLLVSREERRVTKMSEGIGVIVMFMCVRILEAIDGDQIALLVRHNIFIHAQTSLPFSVFLRSPCSRRGSRLSPSELPVSCRREINHQPLSLLINHITSPISSTYVSVTAVAVAVTVVIIVMSSGATERLGKLRSETTSYRRLTSELEDVARIHIAG